MAGTPAPHALRPRRYIRYIGYIRSLLRMRSDLAAGPACLHAHVVVVHVAHVVVEPLVELDRQRAPQSAVAEGAAATADGGGGGVGA